MQLSFNPFRQVVLLFFVSIVFAFVTMVFYFASAYSTFLSLELICISGNSFNLAIVLDPISVSFGSLVTFISGCVFMFGCWYMSGDNFFWRFMWLLLLFVLSMNLLIFSGSLLMLMVGWDGLGITSFLLIVYYQSTSSYNAGFLTLLINRIGDVLIMGTMYYFVVSGSSILLFDNMASTALLILAVAAMTKSAQYPFSSWLPAAMAAPTPVSALVHSSTLVTAGIYLLIRICVSTDLGSHVYEVLLLAGCITSVVGGFCAWQENDIKKVIAFSTLSQLGLMVISIGLGCPELALLHLYMHALFKALLFLAGGDLLMQMYGVQDLRLLGGVIKRRPLSLIFFNISALCLAGFPFVSSYYSKHAILGAMLTYSMNTFAQVLLYVALLLTSAYMFRMLRLLNWSLSSGSPIISFSSKYNYAYWLPMVLLYLGSIVLGCTVVSLDVSLMTCHFYNIIFDISLYLVALIGISMGVLGKLRASSVVASMFFVRDLWSGSPKCGFHSCKVASNFEYSWSEPAAYTTQWSVNFTVMLLLVKWPIQSFNYLRHVFVMMGLLMFYWYL
uniref:NADH dehydrogenase subunit 5 n=1 Tax=Satsuma myomphala TaxID=358001 RepID=UPI0030018DC4